MRHKALKTLSYLAMSALILAILLVPLTAVSASGGGWPSTNELNKNAENPSYGDRYGATHYFDVVSIDGCEVTIEFFNTQTWSVVPEYRIDGKEVVGYPAPHPVVDADGNHDPGGSPPRDIIYQYFSVPQGSVVKTFFVEETLEIRLALGAEREFDFDWTMVESEGCGEYVAPEVCGVIGEDGNNLAELARNVFGNEVLWYDLAARYDLEDPYIVRPGEEYCLPRYTNPGDYLTGPQDPNTLPLGILGLAGLAALIGAAVVFNPRRFRGEH